MKKIIKNRKFKKCLITGITGSGGSYLANYIKFVSPKTKIYGTSRKVKGLINNYTIKKLDLRECSKLKKYLNKIKPDLIFHLASDANVRGSFDNPKKIIQNNSQITLNLLECIRTIKIDPIIIICSSSEVYGEVNRGELPLSEKQIMRPVSPYAVSKSFQDLLAQVYFKSYKLKVIITRMFSYTNARRKNLFQSSFARQIKKIKNKKQKILYHGNLNSIRTMIDVDDAMRAYWMAATKGKVGEIYNIGGNRPLSVKQILSRLIKLSKIKVITKLDTNLIRPKDVTLQIPCSKKFKKHTGWRPKITVDQSLRKLLRDV